ncbi:phage tail tape measure protein, TP901 family [Paenibacillus mucilaginosus 3016]|uniref:Phage tail tape measure protein, TP901 family n=1 Tax=Paenibacillus mucilaginosus 3016 TaxID=1116391 RepID=H6NDT5_9BACL|nr:phage tail tape measure protein [Paenibacillus mucilaginosus]AFC32134.1 phage tail tape measure protein, TP901 family [Paenibacillus mucilaginosus 3016]WFA20636.1 phage tail tape measure protein [Paenibacillus mucilaginosus]
MDKYLRKLALSVAWEIEDGPLRKANKAMDELKRRMGDGTARKFERELASAGSKATQSSRSMDKLTSSICQSSSAMDALKKSATGAFQSIQRVTGSATGMLRNTAVGSGVAAAAGATLLASNSMSRAMDFEAQLSSIQALTGLSNEGMKAVEDKALAVGAATKYSALEAARGSEELLKAGMKIERVVSEGLQAGLDLATAGGLSLEEAAATLGRTLNTFKKDGLEAADVANILAGAANTSATSVHELGYALASVGGVQDMTGGNLKDVITAIGLMSNDGAIGGSDPGTSIKSLLLNLQASGDKESGLFDEIGLGNDAKNLFFDNGKIKNLEGIADAIQKVFAPMNDQQRLKMFDEIFGSDGIRAASMLFKNGSEGVRQFQKDMLNVTAYDVAKKKMDNTRGSIEELKGAFETLQIRTLKPFLPFARQLFDGLGNVVERNEDRIVSSANRMADYLREKYIDNQAFRDLSFEAKVDYVFNDIEDTFMAWYNKTGREKAYNISREITSTLATSLAEASGPLTQIGVSLGAGIVKGVAQGVADAAKSVPILGPLVQEVSTGVSDLFQAIGDVKSTYDAAVTMVNNHYNGYGSTANSEAYNAEQMEIGRQFDGSHEDGHPYIPFDGYRAELHKGERVLTAEENRAYNSGQTPSGGMQLPPIVQHFHGNTSREDAYNGTMAALDAYARSIMRRDPQPVVR